MQSILEKLNIKLATLLEAEGDPASWKDPDSPDYDRQVAEDALYNTIGPLLDTPRWTTKWEAKGGTPPVPEFSPGGKAPRWTPNEIVMAYAGDPELLFKASGNPRSPGYGRLGGAPMFRLARRVARRYERAGDTQFIADLYMNGFVPLMQMMAPGYDEGRSPFPKYAHANVRSAMEQGVGGSEPGMMAGGEASTYYSDPSGQFKKRAPTVCANCYRPTKNTKKPCEGCGGTKFMQPGTSGYEKSGWVQHSATGLQGILKMDDPAAIRDAANMVKGKYRTERHLDKHPDNPFGQFSSAYYTTVNNYADAIESGDEQRIKEAKSSVESLLDHIQQWQTPIRGAATGLGSAISTKDRARSVEATRKSIINRVSRMGDGELTRLQGVPVERHGESYVLYSVDDEGNVAYTTDDKGRKVKSVRYTANSPNEVAEILASVQGVRIQSINQSDETTGEKWADIEPGEAEEESWMDPEILEHVLEICLQTDIGKLLKSSKKYNKMALDGGAKPITTYDLEGNEVIRADLGGPMTVTELRYVIRYLGPLGSNYPGRGVVRTATNKIRGQHGWWKYGEDPELEPLPKAKVGDAGNWRSIWIQLDYPMMGPTEIANEMTEEVKQLHQKGITTTNTEKVLAGQPAASKNAVSAQTRAGKIKLLVIGDIFRHQEGLAESLIKDSPILEDIVRMDPVDRMLMAEACEQIVARIDRALMEVAPEGWEGTVKAMKKDKKVKNPWALAWHMKNKGYESHKKE